MEKKIIWLRGSNEIERSCEKKVRLGQSFLKCPRHGEGKGGKEEKEVSNWRTACIGCPVAKGGINNRVHPVE